jgi:transposase
MEENMSLKPHPLGPIPEETRKLGEQLLAEDDVMRMIGDKFAEIVKDQDFATMYSHTGQPALSPARLALVSVLQAVEHISDRQALRMLRTRIDWKYALHLPLDYAGFDASVLSEFRDRLVANQAERKIFDALLERMKTEGMLKGRGMQRTDSLLIMGAVRELNRLELVMETVRLALTAIAKQDAQWVRENVPAQWLEKYGQWTQAERLVREKGTKAKRETEKLLIEAGKDGYLLLEKIAGSEFMELEQVKTLAQVWSQQYRFSEAVAQLQNPKEVGIEGKEIINSPHDREVRYTKKRAQEVTGYKLQLTETASEDAPAIITDVEVTASTDYDGAAIEGIHERLSERDLLPEQHLVDSAYISGQTIVESQEREVELLGPIQPNTSFTARQGEGFSIEDFHLDFNNKQAICPQGKECQMWTDSVRSDNGQAMFQIRWAAAVCVTCPFRDKCVQGNSGRVIQISHHYPAIAQRRLAQQTNEFKDRYRRRAGIEASFSYLVINCDARSTPYCGKVKTRLHYLLIATAVNIRRLVAWQSGQRPERKRSSPLQKVMGILIRLRYFLPRLSISFFTLFEKGSPAIT